MKRKICITNLLLLLICFFLDMTGLSIQGNVLVSRALKEDGLFFGIYAILFISFILKSKIAHYFLTVWLFLWFVTQFFSHWYYTLTNSSAQKIAYFYDTIKLIDSSSIYIPDLYQIILHLFILSSFICMIVLSRGLNKSST
ncbi:MAG: hypothetical protein ACVCEJ_08840 [Candidatus Izemoplasmataceae bacterium]